MRFKRYSQPLVTSGSVGAMSRVDAFLAAARAAASLEALVGNERELRKSAPGLARAVPVTERASATVKAPILPILIEFSLAISSNPSDSATDRDAEREA